MSHPCRGGVGEVPADAAGVKQILRDLDYVGVRKCALRPDIVGKVDQLREGVDDVNIGADIGFDKSNEF
jgi:hypothetical protein